MKVAITGLLPAGHQTESISQVAARWIWLARKAEF
jgi:hypothetical protein